MNKILKTLLTIIEVGEGTTISVFSRIGSLWHVKLSFKV